MSSPGVRISEYAMSRSLAAASSSSARVGTTRAVQALNAAVDGRSSHIEEPTTHISREVVTHHQSQLVAATDDERKQMAQAIVNAVCQYLGQLSLHEKHTEVLEAITNITVEPPDLREVLEAIGETRSRFDLVAAKMEELDRDVLHSQRHAELIETITQVKVDAPNLDPIVNAVNRSSEVLAIVERRLHQMEEGVLHKHTEVSSTVVAPPDLSPLRAMLSDITSMMQVEMPRVAEISERLAILERAISQGHQQSDVLQAIQRIELPPPDFRPVSQAIDRQLEAFAVLDSRLQRLEEVDSKVSRQQQELLTVGMGSSGPSDWAPVQAGLTDTTRKIDMQSEYLASLEQRMAAIEGALQVNFKGNHKELIEAISSIVIERPDFDPVLSQLATHHRVQAGIDQKLQEMHSLHSGLWRGQEELREIIKETSASPVDLGPVQSTLRDMRGQAEAQARAVAQLDGRLASLEKGNSEQRRLLEAILQALPDGFDKQMSDIRAELKRTREVLQEDLQASHAALAGEVNAAQKEVQELRKETGSDAAMLQKEARAVPQATAELLLKSLLPAMQQYASEQMQALSQLNVDPDTASIAASVCEKLKKTTLNVDNSELIKLMSWMPEMYTKVSEVHGKVSKSNIHYDPSDVLRAMTSLKPPSQEAIAEIVVERLHKDRLKVDSTEVLQALARLPVEPDVEAIAVAVHERLKRAHLKVDSSDVMQALKGLPDEDGIAAAVLEKVRRCTLKVDQSEVLRALSSLRPPPDELLIADAVHEKLSKTAVTVAHHGELMRAIKAIPTQQDFSPVLAQIEAQAVDIAPVLEGIAVLKQTADPSEVLNALAALPDHQMIAEAVHDRLSRTTLNVDHGDVLRAMAKLRPPPDQEEVAAAVYAKLQRSGLSVDQTEVLRAISQLPSNSDVADAVHDKVMKSSMTTNHYAELMKAIRAIPVEHDHEGIAQVVNDRIRRSGVFQVDHTPVMKAIATLPDHHTVADAVHDRIRATTLTVDHTDVVDAIGRITFEQDHDAIADAVHSRVTSTAMTLDHHDQLMRTLGSLPSHDDIAGAVHAKMASNTWSVDNAEVLQAIRRIPVEPDHDTIAMAVHERLRTSPPMIVDMSEVLQEIRRLKIQPDLSPVLNAIAGLDFSPILEAIAKITLQVSLGGAVVSSQTLAGAIGTPSPALASRIPPPMPQQAGASQSSSAFKAVSACGGAAQSSQAADSPQRELFSPRVAETSSATTPVHYGNEDSPYRCICGFSCGTHAALERHFLKASGSGNHGRLIGETVAQALTSAATSARMAPTSAETTVESQRYLRSRRHNTDYR